MTIVLNKFHDATLVGVRLDWATGSTIVTLQTAADGEVDIEIVDCIEVLLPRREEWGRSESVMSVGALDGDLRSGLSIEMQSGDRLVIRGNASRHIA